VGKEAALALLKEQNTKGALDKYMADQILPYMVLTGKKSKVAVSEVTDHCKTNIWVIKKFLKESSSQQGQFKIKDNTITYLQ